LLDLDNSILIERKNKIKKLYDGYYLQIYAQYFCLVEMGYKIAKLKFYSISDNKNYFVPIPNNNDKEKLKTVILKMKNFSLKDKFEQNISKCKMCIYRELCDYYKNDE
jgi:CRISPR-associated protein Cas4